MTDDIIIARLDGSMLDGAETLEKLCFAEPWSAASLALLCSERGVGYAALTNRGEVLAYGGMLIVLDEGQITNIVVHPDCRHIGLGRKILSSLLGYARNGGCVTVSLEVRESNTVARSLYLSCGFETVGRRQGFYKNPREAALVMVKSFTDRKKDS